MRGRKPKRREAPPRPEEEYSGQRIEEYHLCGQPVYAQAFRKPGVWSGFTYYFHWYASRDPKKAPTRLERCPKCGGAIRRESIRTGAEQFLYEISQELLALQLERDADKWIESHAQKNPRP